MKSESEIVKYKPFKIIHKYKNNYGRNQYLMYIFIGSLLSEEMMSILNKIKKLNIIETLNKITRQDLKILLHG